MSRSLILLLLAPCAALASLLVQEPDADAVLAREHRRLQGELDVAGGNLSERTVQLGKHLSEHGPEGWMREHVSGLEREKLRYGTVYIGMSGDSLLCWSGQPSIVAHNLPAKGAGHLWLRNGLWLHAMHEAGGVRLHGLRPLWSTPPIENNYLVPGPHPSLGLQPGIRIMSAGAFEITDVQGATMFAIGWRDGAMEVAGWLWLKLLLLILASALLLAGAWDHCLRWSGRGRRWFATAVFICALLALRVLWLVLLPGSALYRLPVFDPAVYATSFGFASMGDLCINALLLLLGAGFARVALMNARRSELPGPAVPLAWVMLLLCAAWVSSITIGLVNDSSVELDPYHILGLGPFSALALLAMAMLFLSWVLLADALVYLVRPVLRPLLAWSSLIVLLAVSSLLYHRAGVFDPVVVSWPLPMVLLLYHARAMGIRFGHVVVGVALFAGLGTHLLSRHSAVREMRERQVLAERLATREDPVVEQLFQEVAPALRSDQALYNMLAERLPCSSVDLDRTVRQRFFGGYWERYDVRLFGFATNGGLRCASDPEPPRSFDQATGMFSDLHAVADMPELFIEEQAGRSPFYHARVAVMPSDSLPPAQLIVELYPRSVAQGPGFPALLLSGDDLLSRKAWRYGFARYENGLLVEQRGSFLHPLHWDRDMGDDGMLWYAERGHQHLAKGDPATTLVVLNLPQPAFLDRATTFSYLFALFGLLLTMAMGIRALLRVRRLPSPGIGVKVRMALVLFTIAGLVFFGIGSRRLLSRQYEQRFEASMLERARSIHQELQQKFDGEPSLGQRHEAYLEHLLAKLSNVFFTDITVYDLRGRLLATSRPQIFASGLLGTRMDGVAYERMVLSGSSAFIHEESIGKAFFRTAYMPLRDRKGQVMAYLALPGFVDQQQQEEERAGVLVAVANLFVLLFAMSVLVAVFISNWTTRPLDLLKTALGRVALQGANEPIRYRGDDEVGQLVEVYNRKVEELRESAERLARSERESAWREMARQVAHEIKNPLTPMKLSIQHFQRTWAPDAPDAVEKLERFSRGMVEQIDTLSGIASAFSNFAQMPRAQAEDLDLAEVAEAAMSVFRATPGMLCALRREQPGPLPVHADREQLLRVFNNLIKNAVQAIPDGQEGQISVVLRQADDEVIAEVHDNGTGIAEEDRERIFRPNFTTKGSGMGLGLAMVQRMVEGAGGRVWFESRLGEGSTFFVALPLRK